MVLWGGALLPFVLRVVAGACVGRWTGQPRMPPRERQHEEVFVLGDSFAVGLGAVAGAWVDHGSGQTRMPPQSDGTRGFWFCGGALLPFVLRACCGGMCWPVDRPATHAAAGAAARGVRGGLGDSFTRLGVDSTRGGGFCFFFGGLLRCRRGIVSHAQERRHES